MAELDLNKLYLQAKNSEPGAEKVFFEALSARFSLFLLRRIRNKQDREEIAQNALMYIGSEYKSIEIKLSFAAWAYKVLDFRIKAFLKTRSRTDKREIVMTDSDWADSTPSPDCDPDLKRRLLDCLGKIGRANLKYARILNLKNQGHETETICTKLKVTPSNYYSILSRARTLLAHCLEQGAIN